MSEMVTTECNSFLMSLCGPLSGGGGGGGGGGVSSPYNYAVKNGYTGTEEEFAIAFVGACSNAIMFDTICNKLVLQADSVEKVNDLFVEWWNINSQFCADKALLLNRWFGNVLKDDRVHGVKLPLFATSTSAIGELTDDSVGLSCTPSTAAVAGKDDFAFLPQFWCLEVAMERNADGSHTINKVEHIDYKDAVKLRRFLSERSKILPRRTTGTCAMHQRQLTEAIKRARQIALLPFVTD